MGLIFVMIMIDGMDEWMTTGHMVLARASQLALIQTTTGSNKMVCRTLQETVLIPNLSLTMTTNISSHQWFAVA